MMLLAVRIKCVDDAVNYNNSKFIIGFGSTFPIPDTTCVISMHITWSDNGLLEMRFYHLY